MVFTFHIDTASIGQILRQPVTSTILLYMKSFFTFLLFVTFCASYSALAKSTNLVLNWKAEPQFGGFYEAERLGLYKKYGLDIKILQGGSGTPTVQMLASGSADFAIVSGDEMLVINEKGANLIALFAVYQKNPQGIMVHKARGFKNLEEVYQSEGSLLIQSGYPFAQYLEEKFKNNKKVKTAPYQGGVSLFVTDKNISQQCFITSEPLIAKNQNADPQTFLISDEGFNPYLTILAVRRDRMEKQPSAIKNIVAATREGWDSYLQNPAPANSIMAKLNPSLDLKTFALSASVQTPFIKPSATARVGSMESGRWQQLAEQLYKLGILKTLPTDYSALFLTF